jgi:hypothetical protein
MITTCLCIVLVIAYISSCVVGRLELEEYHPIVSEPKQGTEIAAFWEPHAPDSGDLRDIAEPLIPDLFEGWNERPESLEPQFAEHSEMVEADTEPRDEFIPPQDSELPDLSDDNRESIVTDSNLLHESTVSEQDPTCLQDCTAKTLIDDECARTKCQLQYRICQWSSECAWIYNCIQKCTDVSCALRCAENANDTTRKILDAALSCLVQNGCISI